MGTDGVAPYYTQAELARVAGVGRSAVSEAVRRGQLATVPTIGGTPLVRRAEAERWLRDKRGPGRPPAGGKAKKSGAKVGGKKWRRRRPTPSGGRRPSSAAAG